MGARKDRVAVVAFQLQPAQGRHTAGVEMRAILGGHDAHVGTHRHAVKAASGDNPQFDQGAIRVGLCIQNSHLHLIVEAEDKTALARGMQGFQISCARLLNAEISRRTGVKRLGQVFADRYHAVPLTTPTQVRHALAYVLNNWRRHGEDVGVFRTRHDVYSTGLQSNAWVDAPPVISLRGIQLLPVSFPTTWLLEHGWKKIGPIDAWARPGPSG